MAMPLPKILCGDRWSETTARHILPLLVWCAEHGKKITYGQLDSELQRRNWGHHVNVVVYGHPAGAIGNALLETEKNWGERIPPLNALIVNAESGIPGNGCDYYLATYLERSHEGLTLQQRKAMAEEIMEDVWSFTKWPEVLAQYDLPPVIDGIPSLQSASTPTEPRRGGWSSEPESEEHQQLKRWVARNPQILKAKVEFGHGEMERLFASADRVDVYFSHASGCVAVEVKASNANDADLERGVYQCVKYQALLRAELKAEGKIPNGLAVLVSERPFSMRLQELADLLRVRVIIVSPARDDRRK